MPPHLGHHQGKRYINGPAARPRYGKDKGKAMKKERISSLLIAAGLSFIFAYAAHSWGGGLIVGICYFWASLLIAKRKDKKSRE